MRRILPYFYTFSFLFFFYLQESAIPVDPFFIQYFDNRYGLSDSFNNKPFKDADNILRVATWDGLNMYDGIAFPCIYTL